MNDISAAQKSSAIQFSTNKYQEFILSYIEYCQKDFNNYIKNKAFWTQSNEYVSIIIDGTVKATEDSENDAKTAAATSVGGELNEGGSAIVIKVDGTLKRTISFVTFEGSKIPTTADNCGELS